MRRIDHVRVLNTHRSACARTPLGTPLADYPASADRANLDYLLCGAGLSAGLVVEGIHTHQWGVLSPLLLIIVLMGRLLESTSWIRGMHLVVCSEGLLHLRYVEAASIRWEEIGDLWRDRRGKYGFSRANGTRFIVNHDFRHAEELSATIEHEVTQHQLPKALASYQCGTPLRFGSLEVNRQGISARGAVLPWSSIGAAQIYGGVLVVRRKGTVLHGLYVSVEETPNLRVLEALIDTLLQGEPV